MVHHRVGQIGAEKPVPLVHQRRDDELKEPGLYLRHRRRLPVAQGRHRQVELPLVVALPEELLAHLGAPLLADVPRAARVRDVRTLERYLQDEVAVGGVAHVQRIPAQVVPEPADKLLLPRNVRRQYERADLPLQLGPYVLHLFRDAALQQAADGRPPVMVLQHGRVLVQRRQMVGGRYQERLVHARMVEIVRDGTDQRGHDFERAQILQNALLLQEAVHRLRDVRRVYRVVHEIPTTSDRLERKRVEAPVVDAIENALHLTVQHIVQDGLIEGEAARQQLLPAALVHGEEAAGTGVPPPGQLAALLRHQCLEQGPVLFGDSSHGRTVQCPPRIVLLHLVVTVQQHYGWGGRESEEVQEEGQKLIHGTGICNI
uniref:Uncharacterized protein n=1 Tax=Anopheles merus TaxID=30066 RepID=A0A182UU07_ANOME